MADIGLIGLGAMGENMALLFADKGLRASIYKRTPQKVELTVQRAQKELPDKSENLQGYQDLPTFVESLQIPRKVIVILSHGKPVDEVIDQLESLLSKGDLIIDAGNEWYQETERRMERVAKRGILYLGMGVSGGYQSARYGPSMSPGVFDRIFKIYIPGGTQTAYQMVEAILKKIAASSDYGPCVTYIGPKGSGHYVKMVHNGIEQGMMSSVVEVYSLLKMVLQLDNHEIHKIFEKWNNDSKELRNCFLVDITSKITATKDKQKSGEYLIDQVVDKVVQDADNSEGTGVWTVKEAAERHIPCPTIACAHFFRTTSADKMCRTQIAKIVGNIGIGSPPVNAGKLIEDLEQVLFFSFLCCFAQGCNLIQRASNDFSWNIQLSDVIKIWKAGCIISIDSMIDLLVVIYQYQPLLSNVLVYPKFSELLNEREGIARRIVSLGLGSGLALPALSASLNYFASYRQEKLISMSLMQAQLDFFGMHKFKRLDEYDIGDPDKAQEKHIEWEEQYKTS